MSEYKDFKDMTLNELAELYVKHRDIKADLKEHDTTNQKIFDLIRKKLIPEKMEEMGIDNVKLKDIGRVSIRGEIYASINDKSAGYAWLRENGHEDLIRDDVNHSTFKAFCKEQIQLGVELPDELFKITPYDMAVITKN